MAQKKTGQLPAEKTKEKMAQKKMQKAKRAESKKKGEFRGGSSAQLTLSLMSRLRHCPLCFN